METTKNVDTVENQALGKIEGAIKEAVNGSIDKVESKISEMEVKSAEKIGKLTDVMAEFVAIAKEEKSQIKARSFSDALEGNNKIASFEFKSLEASKELVQKIGSEVRLQESGRCLHDSAKESKSIINNAYNTFNNQDGGFSITPPVYSGLININRLVYAPIAALSKQIYGGLNGAQYVTYDSSQIDVLESSELTAAQVGDRLKEGRIVIQPQKEDAVHLISQTYIDFNTNGGTYHNIIDLHNEALNKRIEMKVNNRAMNILKKAITDGTVTSRDTLASGTISIEDFFDLAQALKPDYSGNAIFMVDYSVLTKISQEVGNDGQFKWAPYGIFQRQGNLGVFTSPTGTIKFLGIHPLAQVSFDKFVEGGSNAGKVIGVYADFSELIGIVSNDYSIFRLLENRIDEDVIRLYKRIYAGAGILNKESAVAIKIKA